MGAHGGPNLAEDGLVFYYDTDNGKSYKGVPTTNLAPYISTHGITEFTLSSLPEGVSTIHSKGAIVNGTTDWADIFQTSGYSIPAGERLVISAWVYIPADKVNNRLNINADINGNNTGLASWHDLAAGQWHKLVGSWLNNTGATANATYTRVEPWTPAEWTGGTNTAYGINFMVESGPFGADYKGSQALPANTTRSATESLYDFISDSALDVSNMSFDSNADITFDGTNDYIQLSSTIRNIFTSAPNCIELILKKSSAVQRDMVVFDVDITRWNLNYNMYVANQWSFDFYDGTEHVIAAGNYDDQYVHFVLQQLSDGTMEIYANGELKGSEAAGNLAPNTSNPRIGSRSNGDSRYFEGELPLFKIYNQALTAEEVQNNFNGIRSRFGI